MRLLRPAIWINFGWAVRTLVTLGVLSFLRLTEGSLELELGLLFLAGLSMQQLKTRCTTIRLEQLSWLQSTH